MTEAIALGVMYVITGIGVDVGFHRLFTHRGFECTVWLKNVLAISGMMAGVGTLAWWVASHRRHHELSDSVGDPHSPYFSNDGRMSFLPGLFHSHCGWLYNHDLPNPLHYCPDIVRNAPIMVLNRLHLLWVAIGLIAPAIFGGIVLENFAGALSCFVWGGLFA